MIAVEGFTTLKRVDRLAAGFAAAADRDAFLGAIPAGTATGHSVQFGFGEFAGPQA
jgi:hypothetical protein